ncbi:MAG: divalent metal cation transporter [Alphaproteobacteria bacterium]|nr:divalent metal cation transporter [Alphaproteobacteria bacterium]
MTRGRAVPNHSPHGASGKRHIWQILGPGLITGASDDDPSGIATYSQAGAQLGYGLAWTMLFSFPLMAAIQEICARIGRVTGHGIAGNMRRHYHPALLHGAVWLLIGANLFNIGADLSAMGDVVHMLVGGPRLLYIAAFAAFCVVAEVYMRYARYIGLLKWTAMSLLAYVAAALAVNVPWGTVIDATFRPTITLDSAFALTAVLGTTISPYLLFWQSSDEAERERRDRHAHPLLRSSVDAVAEFHRIRVDTWIGMFLSNLIGWFIIVTVAATLHTHGVTNIDTSSQAAEALRPIAGPFAYAVFSLGIIGTGLLTVPVLAGSAAYALGEALHWPVGLARRPMNAKAFYGAIATATALGLGMNLTPLDPIKALFWSAVLNGVAVTPLMLATMLLARNRRVMGELVLPAPLAAAGWVATLAMAGTTILMVATWGQG